ncbi:hypothetical protein WG8_3875, partial [Paenibacillus sp. Aloe-11]
GRGRRKSTHGISMSSSSSENSSLSYGGDTHISRSESRLRLDGVQDNGPGERTPGR